MSGQLHASAALTPGRGPSISSVEGWVCPTAGQDKVAK